MQPDKLILSPVFKLVFISVLGLTLFCLLANLGIAYATAGIKEARDIPDLTRQSYNLCAFGWQSGFGAILGLIGGKLVK